MGNSYWKIYLWNPSIRKITIAGTTNNNALANVTLGFAYHPQNNDFKILRLVSYPCKKKAPAEVQVYTLSTASWRRFVIPGSLSGSSIWGISESPSLFFNGALHFLALAGTQNDIFNRFILTFDVDEERFHEIMLPPNYLSEKYVRHTKCLTVFKGLLALVVFNCETEQSDICHIWVMREYGVVESWTKISVPIEGVARFFGCTVKGELVMGKRSPSQIFSFDPESLNEEILAIPAAKDVIYTDYFAESLNLLDRLNAKDY
ncbi:F-box protein At3g07870-like [Quercus robur]|uniref:F-box protein At3g07870-like n=1 Tax=Quercus robur TaxID=38942 RepID=UPI0021622630|nr:F-box protein At3g07870-like [Quercus robur]